MSDFKPIILEISLKEFNNMDEKLNVDEKKHLLNYPVIYIISHKDKDGKYLIYVGETNNINRRVAQHLRYAKQKGGDWKKLMRSKASKIFVIGQKYFNKSLTLDIETRLLQYSLSVDAVKKILNSRENAQGLYYTVDKMDAIFSETWKDLREQNQNLFPLERFITDSAIFRASPFQRLTDGQQQAKDKIISRAEAAMIKDVSGQLILVEGEAGTGKTVLMSSLFYDLHLFAKAGNESNLLNGIEVSLVVNHDQQLKVYKQIVKKLGIKNKEKSLVVSKPTPFINKMRLEKKVVDIVLIDEAHLLLTQGKQSYQGQDQLEDILERAKVVIAIFDKKQVLSTECFRNEKQLNEMFKKAKLSGNLITLKNQLRMNADSHTTEWIRNMIDKKEIASIPKRDSKGYQIKIFNSPKDLFDEIKAKAKDEKSGLSRMIATYDWEFKKGKEPENEEYWEVKIDDWKMPWNLQLPVEDKELAWAEQNQTINEVGSIFTIQGFDLNFAGVIIGPSVQYSNGEIIFEPDKSKNQKAIRYRNMQDGTKIKDEDYFLENELNVLLTRGVNGLYIYAVDGALRNMLLKAQKGEL